MEARCIPSVKVLTADDLKRLFLVVAEAIISKIETRKVVALASAITDPTRLPESNTAVYLKTVYRCIIPWTSKVRFSHIITVSILESL